MRYFKHIINVKIWLALVVVALAACTEEEGLVKNIQPQTITMKLNGGIIPFDADNATRAEDWNWKEGDVIYMSLDDFGRTPYYTKAAATYQGSEWKVSVVGDVNFHSGGICIARYLDTKSNNKEKDGIIENMGYEDELYISSGSYDYDFDAKVLTVNISLSPQTSRLRLKQAENDKSDIDITIKGLCYIDKYSLGKPEDYWEYESIPSALGNFGYYHRDSIITLKGSLPEYIYGNFARGKHQLTIINNADGNNLTFTRTFDDNVLKIGESGRLTIPTKDNYKSLGWTMEKKSVDIEAVDLGLPSGTKWANMNIGASRPEDYGDYYAWGETNPKEEFNFSTYLFRDNSSKLTKYCDNPNVGLEDKIYVLEASDDAATSYMKDAMWRLPTIDEVQELLDNTYKKYDQINGVNGCLFTSKKNGNSIFLPTAGYRNDTDVLVSGSEGQYWTSSLSLRSNTLNYEAYYLGIYNDCYTSSKKRYYGMSVRPVYGTILFTNSTYLDFSSTNKEEKVTLRANVPWKVESKPNWLTLSSEQGTSDETITVTVTEENPLKESRDGELVFVTNDGSIKKRIECVQEANAGADEKLTFTVNGVSFDMIRVEAGTFQMGDVEYVGDPVHTVTLTKDYYIGETEVTQALWYAVMGQKPTSDGDHWKSIFGLGDNRPAYYVSWDDSQEFITKLNQLTGKTFRLPTEAEWEFAARGGNKSKGYKYSGSNAIDDVAWYTENSYRKGSSSPDYGTHDVATQQANELGIYDMSGNVWEWCSDWYGSYSSSAQTDPTGPTSGSTRVCRGGSWFQGAWYCSVSYRGYLSYDNFDVGLRLALQ